MVTIKNFKNFLAKALIWKANPSHAKDIMFGPYRYKEFIFPWVRFKFPYYNRFSDQLIPGKFVQDLTKRDSQLLYELNAETAAEQGQAEASRIHQAAAAEEQLTRASSAVATATTVTTTPVQAMPTVRPPTISPTPEAVPEAFSKAFENEPEYKTNPGVKFQPGIGNTLQNFGSRGATFFRNNVGKYLTVGNIGTAVATGIGAVAGAALGPIGAVAGGVAGGATALGIRNNGGVPDFLKNAGNSSLDTLQRITQPGGTAGGPGLPGFSPKSSKKVLWVFLGIFFLMVIGAGLLGGLPGNTPIGEAAPLPTGSGDIASCTFYRGGDPTPGQKFNIPAWPALINSVASQVGVPAVVLAGILRVESPGAFSSSDPNYIQHDYDPKPYPYPPYPNPPYPVNPLQGYGVMQFLVSTFQGIDPTRVGKTSVKTDFLTPELDTSGQLQPSSALRIYSIRDSLLAAALKIKDDSGGGSWDNKDTVYKVAEAYYGCLKYSNDPNTSVDEACKTGPFNYGDDLWNSFQGCQATGSVIGVSGCPAIGIISTPYGFNIAGYPANETNEDCGSLPLCHNGIDIVPDATDISVRSTITGKVTAIDSTGTAGAKGKFLEINDSSSGLTITLEHLAIINTNKNTNLPISLGDTISAGETIGTIGSTGNTKGAHLHYKIKKGADPVNPLHYLGSSATLELKLDSNHSLNTYTTIDDITKISYDGVTPVSGDTDIWGRCNK